MENTDITFEQAIEDLEKIVADLEAGEMPLDKSVENFKKGMELSNYCSKLLDEAEKTISILVKQRDGTMQEEKFELE